MQPRRGWRILWRMLRLLPSLLLALLPACSSTRWFAPRENLNGTSPSGFPAAVYPVQAGDTTRGDVRIWSDGTSLEEADGQADVPLLHVGFEIENTGSTALAIDLGALRVERLWWDDQSLAELRPTRVEGQTSAPAGGRATVQFWFHPGVEVAPRKVAAFDVRWRVCADADLVFDQVTPFSPWVRDDPWDDRWHYGGGFGFGLGFGAWRWCR